MKITRGAINEQRRRRYEAVQTLKGMDLLKLPTADADAWVDANVKGIADARMLLKQLVVALHALYILAVDE